MLETAKTKLDDKTVVNTKAIAKMFNMTERNVRYLVEEGIIARVAHGRYGTGAFKGVACIRSRSMRRSQAENALRTGVYQVLGEAKGGKHREVPLSNEARQLLSERIVNVPRGERVFAPAGEKVYNLSKNT